MVNLLKKLFRCKIAMAAILTAFVSFVLFCIYTPFFGTNDDYIMSILVQNGDTHLIFMNYFLVVQNKTRTKNSFKLNPNKIQLKTQKLMKKVQSPVRLH